MGRLDDDPNGREYVMRISQVCGGPLHVQRARELLPLLDGRPGQHVLEVGCGTGVLVRELVTLTGGAVRVIGVDPSRIILEVAAEDTTDMHQIEYRQMDGRALDFADGSFSAAYCSRVLIHAAEPERVVAEMARVVEPGGRVMCIEPLVQPSTGIDDALRRKVTAWTNPDIARDLPGMLRRAALVDVSITPHVALNAEPPNVRVLREEFLSGHGRYLGSVRDGRCTRDEVLRMFDQMEAVVERGEFLECLVHYAVIGRVR
jgi:SAM-dependent methyltransferase